MCRLRGRGWRPASFPGACWGVCLSVGDPHVVCGTVCSNVTGHVFMAGMPLCIRRIGWLLVLSEPMGHAGAGQNVSLTWDCPSIARLSVSGCNRGVWSTTEDVAHDRTCHNMAHVLCCEGLHLQVRHLSPRAWQDTSCRPPWQE